jgi:hypothetical protein
MCSNGCAAAALMIIFVTAANSSPAGRQGASSADQPGDTLETGGS